MTERRRPLPPPPKRRRRPLPDVRELVRRERPFDPEVPPERYARPHHFAVNAEGGEPIWVVVVDAPQGMEIAAFRDEAGVVEYLNEVIDVEIEDLPDIQPPDPAERNDPDELLSWISDQLSIRVFVEQVIL